MKTYEDQLETTSKEDRSNADFCAGQDSEIVGVGAACAQLGIWALTFQDAAVSWPL